MRLTERYPADAQALGLEGWVVLEFIVGTDGRAEARSLRVVDYSDDVFIDSARATILDALYQPGCYQGSAARVMIRQKLEFHVRHS